MDVKTTTAATASLCIALAATAAEKAQVPPQKFATAQRIEAALSVDGDLGDAAWRSIPWNSGYVLAKKGGEPSEQTRFKVAYSGDALYVAVESFDRDTSTLHPEINDAEWWYVDLAELFVGTGDGETLHLIYTARGNRYEEIPGAVQVRNAGKETWSAASRIGAKSWTCEFKVPMALLGLDPGDSYLTVPFNLCRCISRCREFSSWNFSPSGFSNSAGFGRLAFGGRGYPVPVAGSDEMTFSCWARLPVLPDTAAPRGRTAYALLSWGGFFKLCISGTATFESEFDAQANGTNYQFITRANAAKFFDVGEWAHFAATYSLKSGETALYLNGQHVGSRRDDLRHKTPLLPLPRSVKGSLKVGSLAGGYFPTDGEISNVRFFPRALSQDELSDMERPFWTKLEPGAKALGDVLRARRDRKAAEADRLFKGGRDLRYSIIDPLGKAMYKWDTPLPEDTLDRPLRIVSTPGEYEASAFVVRAKRAVGDFRPVATDLKAEGGETLPASVLDMRIAKVMARAVSAYSKVRVLEPTVLLHDDKLLKVDMKTMRNLMRYDFPSGSRYVDVSEPRDTRGGQKARLSAAEHPIFDAKELRPMDLPARTTIEFWVTSHVPEGTKPGVYRGEIALRTTGGESFGAVPVELRVLPFTLPEPMTRYDPTRPFERAIYHRGQAIDFSPQSPGTITQRGRNESQLRAEFRNMAAHGIQHPCICMNLPMPYWKGNPSVYNPKNGGAPYVPTEAERDYFRRYIRCMREEGMSTNPLYVFNNGNLGFRDHYNRATMHEDLKTVWRLLNEYLLENLGHTNVYYYGVDEAHGQALQNEYDLWEDAGKLGARFYTTMVTRDLPLVAGRIALASVSHNMTKEAAKMQHDAGTRIWSYANPQSNALGLAFPYRVNFGMGEWLANFDGYGVYAYNESNHHPWNQWDGMEWSYVFQTADGVCDLINWEGQREACDDVRYATLLSRLCRENPGSPVSKEALAWLDAVDVTHFFYDPNKTRSKMVEFILKLLPASSAKGRSAGWRVEVGGKTVRLRTSRAYDGGSYQFASFDVMGGECVRVTYPDGKAEEFKVTRPFRRVFDPNDRKEALVLFGNAPDAAIPDRRDPKVRWFGPGLHHAGVIRLCSNETLYIDPEAVVYGSLFASGTNITVTGRGILSGREYRRLNGPFRFFTTFSDCKDLTVRGITITEPCHWSLVFVRCSRVKVEGVRVCAGNMVNDDGIDIVNSSDMTLRDIFVRSVDDSFCLKGNAPAGENGPPCENILLEDATLWTDAANVFRIGYECSAPCFRNFTARNIDVHAYARTCAPPSAKWPHAVMLLQPSNGIRIENMLFDNVRVRSDGSDMHMLVAEPRQLGCFQADGSGGDPYRNSYGGYVKYTCGGSVSNVVLRNVAYVGMRGECKAGVYVTGSNALERVDGVVLQNVTRFGEPVGASSPNVSVGPFATASFPKP